MTGWRVAIGKAFARLLTLQVERPFFIVLFALGTTIPALFAARGLGLKTDFSELLPQNKPSVVEMRRVSARLTSASTLTLVAEVPTPHPDALARFADAIVPRIAALGPDWVGGVEEGTQARRAFFQKEKLLYAPLDKIRELHDDLQARYDYEVHKRLGDNLVDEDEAPQPLTVASLREKLLPPASASAALKDDYGGYYIGEGGRFLAILVRTPVDSGSGEPARKLREKIEGIVRDVDPKRFDPGMNILYTGDFITSVEEFNAVKDDLGHVGLYGIAMVLGAVLLFFLRLRTLLAMAITIGIGLAWTFGVTRYTIGYLNSSTGFLVSIIAGNGINFGIIYMARYLEARRTEGVGPADAVRVAHASTWLATLAAAFAAAISYGSLSITDFRGFKHFGIIGGMGMMLCWLATYLFLPTVLVITERVRPMSDGDSLFRAKLKSNYGRPFAFLAERFPRAVTVVGIVVGALAVGISAHYLLADPMEYDMGRLRNESTSRSAASELSDRVDQIVGRLGQDGMAVMVDRLDQVLPLKHELDLRNERAPKDAKPFEQVVTIFDLLPGDQGAKIPLLADTRALILRARSRGLIADADFGELLPELPPADLAPIGPADLPDQIARAFTEKDGTRGRIVYIAPKEGRSIWDAHYLMLWADSFRSVPLPSGETIRGSGRAVIFADMIQAVVEDAPKAVAASFLGTVLVVLLAFRGGRASWAVIGVLLLGVVWMVAFLALRGIKLNFLNFVALPITFGIGVDYAVNIMQRYRIEGPDKIRRIVIETGGAVILCSLTTTLGYLSLTLSMNRAIVTFGLAAAAGEIACIVAAVLVFPAVLVWRSQRKRKATAEVKSALLA